MQNTIRLLILTLLVQSAALVFAPTYSDAGFLSDCWESLLPTKHLRLPVKRSVLEQAELIPIKKVLIISFVAEGENFPTTQETTTYGTQLGYADSPRIPILTRVREMGALGYELLSASFKADQITLKFRFEPLLVRLSEKPAPPDYVASQRRRMAEGLNLKAWNRMRYSGLGNYENATEKGKILSQKSAAHFGGFADFALIRGERFLRLGSGHSRITMGNDVDTAGEIRFTRAANGTIDTVHLRMKSGGYSPHVASAHLAIEALWDQGIFPRNITISKWDSWSDTVLVLDNSVDN